jgi:exodeoxyribonuclease VIII
MTIVVGGTVVLPPDGHYPDLEMDEYLAWPAVSGSALSVLAKHSPWHLHQAIYHPSASAERSSVALRLGTVAHTAILEPHLMDDLYVLAPEPDPEKYRTAAGKPASNPKATKQYKDECKHLLADNPGKDLIERDVYDRAIQAREVVFANHRAEQLLKADGPVELSCVATDPETNVSVKLRPDKLVDALGFDVNLKTTANAEYNSFASDVWRFGYHRSAALRSMAMGWLGMEIRRSILIAVETDAPAGVAVYELDEGTMDAGEQIVRSMLRVIARCIEKDEWPAYPVEVQSLALPSWAWAKVDEEVQRYV